MKILHIDEYTLFRKMSVKEFREYSDARHKKDTAKCAYWNDVLLNKYCILQSKPKEQPFSIRFRYNPDYIYSLKPNRMLWIMDKTTRVETIK